MTDPAGKSYYQVSFTGVQALVGLVALLAALALAFFLGAKAGFEKSTSVSAPSVVPPGESEAASVPAAPTSTTIAGAPAPATASSSPSPAPASASAPAGTASPPASTQEAPVFEDREAGVPEKAPSRTEIAGESARTAAPAPAPKNPPRKAPAAKEEAAPSGPAAKPASGFYVQIVSTTSKPEASRWKDRLTAKKYRAVLSSVDSSKGTMYRVRLGPYTDRDQANRLAAKISGEFHQKAWVAPAR